VLARAHRECGRPEEALALLGGLTDVRVDAEAADEERVRSLMDLAGIHRSFGRIRIAGRLLGDAAAVAKGLAGRSRDAGRMLLAAEAELAVGRRGLARSWIEEARIAGLAEVDAEVAELRVLAQSGDRKGAELRLRQLLAEHPGHVLGRRTLAAIRRADGDPGGAREHLEAAVNAAPLDGEAGTELAEVLRQLDRPSEAADAARRVVAVRPDWLGALRVLAQAHGDENEWTGAVDALRRAASSHPGDPAVLNDLGVALYEGAGWRNEWLGEAIRTHRSALRLAPDDVPNAYNLARALVRQRGEATHDEAVSLYTGLLPRVREVDLRRRILRNLGLLHSDSFRRWEEAYRCYVEYFELGGEHEAGVLDEWGKVLEGLGQPYRAPPEPRNR
jgi:tetratricopeptide (TPR) repeat protein